MKIAKFKRLGSDGGFETILEHGSILSTHDAYVQLTEWTDVEFKPLHDDAIIEKQLNILDNAESELRNKFQGALNEIERQRAELRAITYVPAQRTDGGVDEYLQ